MTDLFKDHGDDAPSGENLEYDPDFTAMELAAQADEDTDGKEPDYKEVLSKAQAVLERSHDIRAAVFWADSALRLNGLRDFAEATRYIRFCLEDHWATCHPQLDEDDDDDPMMRINAVTNLAGRTTVLRGLRQWAPLSMSRAFGQITLRDIEVSKGEVEPREDETPMPRTDIEGAFKDTDDAELAAFYDAAKAALENVNAIDAVFLEKTPGYGPSLEPLQKMLGSVVDILAEQTGANDVADAAPADAGAEVAAGGAAAPAPSAGGAPGQISSRADVAAALDRIIAYYDAHEPSSPLPILLKRARRLIGADFLTIINDIAPLGVENVNVVGGIEEDYS